MLTRESFLTPLTSWTWKRSIDFLQSRIGFLDSVVFSGGEPTAQSALPSAITEVKAMGYRIGLHTSGAYPERLDKVLPLVDWVGLDIKAPLDERYDLVTGVEGSAETVLISLQQIMASGLDYQLRTTVHPSLHSPEDLADLDLQLQELGASPTVIQQFRIQGCIDAELIASYDRIKIEIFVICGLEPLSIIYEVSRNHTRRHGRRRFQLETCQRSRSLWATWRSLWHRY